MYSYTFDAETGGIILNSTPTNFSKEPRPVYAAEMDILGFADYWEYDKQNDVPYMWAESTAYWYQTRHVCGQPVYKKDIGEDPRMISYVRQYLEKEYPDEYSEFVSKIMWYEDPHAVAATGKERIDITYGMDATTTSSITPAPAAKKTVTVTPKPNTTTSPKVPIDLTKLTRAYLETFKVGEIANQVLRAILASGKIPKNTVDAWKTVSGSKAAFGLSDPILGYSRKDSKGYSRYYDNTLNLYGEDLYLCSQWKINHKARLITWILNWIAANGGKI